MKYQLHQNIYFARDKMQDSLHFNWLFRAICLVDAKYIRYKIGNPDNEEEYMLHKERVFAYELYRQWANIIESECKEPLVLNAELDKIIAEDIDAIGERVDDGKEETESDLKSKTCRRYPDLVLHNGQGNDKVQKIICEIKRQDDSKISSSLILADLYKLACYLDEDKFTKRHFEFGAFILLNGKLEQIKEIKMARIKVSANNYTYRQFKKEMTKHFDNIICVTYDGGILEYKTLKGLL